MANQVIIDEARNQISVIEGQTRIIEVAAQGPQGPVGPRGETGPSGSSILNQITSGSVTASVDIGSAAFTVVSASSNLFNVGSNGNVGIGVSSPTYKLDVLGALKIQGAFYATSNGPKTFLIDRYSNNSFADEFGFRKARGTMETASAVISEDQLGGIEYYGYDGSGFIQSAMIYSNVDGTVSAGSVPGRLSFYVNNGGSTNVNIEAIRINSSGNVGIGTVSPNAKLHVSGSTILGGNTTITGSLLVTGNITAQTLVVQTITSSVLYSSGSNIFGNSLTNTQQFTGSVTVTGSSVSFNGSNGFNWDGVNNRLGIGTGTPSYNLDITGTVRIGNNTNGYIFNSNTISTFGNIFLSIQGDRFFSITDSSYNSVYFRVIRNTGNVLINSTTDTGERFQVSGSSKFDGNMVISGSGTTSATNALLIKDSAGNNMFAIRNDGLLSIIKDSGGVHQMALGSALFTNVNSTGVVTFGNTRHFQITGNPNASTPSLSVVPFTGDLGVGGTNVRFGGSFSRSSGADEFTQLLMNPTINQTSTATGITRGLYVNPTLTSTATFRAIEWTNNASGSTSWGLYGSGSAPNYLAGALGIGTNAPAYSLHVFSNIGIQSGGFLTTISTGVGNVFTSGQTTSIGRYFSLYADAADVNFTSGADTTGRMTLAPRGNSVVKIYGATGNVVIQNGGTFTDTGERLQVSGSARITDGLVVTGSITSVNSIYSNGLLYTPAGIFCDNNLARFRHVTVGVNQGAGTGFIQPEDGTQSIGIRTGTSFGGTTRLLVTSTGNVLINNTVDDTVNKLQVSGSSRFSGNMVITGSATITAGVGVSGTSTFTIGNNQNFRLTGAVGGDLTYAYASFFNTTYVASLIGTNVGLRGTSGVFLGNGDTSYTVVIQNNRVAIGHLSPTALLHVSGTTGGLFEIDSDTSANILYVSSSGNVGIGTNTPSTALDIRGNRATVSITDTNSGGTNPTFFGAYADVLQLSVNRNPSTGVFSQGSKTSSQISLVGSAGLGAISFYTTNVNGVIPNEIVRIYGTGNVSIQNGGTFTDSGDRLQVSGSSRFNGNVLISGSGNTSATNALTVQNSANASLLTVRNDGRITLASTPTIQSTTGNITLSSVDVPTRTLTYDTLNNTLTFSSFGTQAFVGARFTDNATSTTYISPDGINAVGGAKITSYDAAGNVAITCSNNGNRSIVLKGLGSLGAVLIGNITTTNGTQYNAILRCDSTTQGFMPPRMTTAQKNAIASPTAGLVVYDTTLSKLCVYTTTWETITSS